LAITLKADPYTIVVIPGIRGPAAYTTGGFNLSVPQLSKVDYAEVVPGRISAQFQLSYFTGLGFFVTSGSGNVVTVTAMLPAVSWGIELPSGSGLSDAILNLKAYGH